MALRGTKTLLVLKLDGERGYGIHEERVLHKGQRVFKVTRVGSLSPAERAGITAGDELLSVRVLGVDKKPYPWCDMALSRIEELHEILFISIKVRKPLGVAISELQDQRQKTMSGWVSKAKVIQTGYTRMRGDFIQEQLQRVVVRMYEMERAYFALRWKLLPKTERDKYMPPMDLKFADESRLPGLKLADDDDTGDRGFTIPIDLRSLGTIPTLGGSISGSYSSALPSVTTAGDTNDRETDLESVVTPAAVGEVRFVLVKTEPRD